MDKKILIIDDDKAVLHSCRIIFEKTTYEVHTTTDPKEGLELSSQNTFDLILCDWKMPEYDGLEVVAQLETRAPDAAVIMFSGYPTLERATEAMKRGAMDFLPKPFTPEELLQVAERALEQKQKRQQRALSRFRKVWQTFPVPSLDDKGPKNIAETVAGSVGVTKATSPWVSLFVLGVLAGAYIGFGGLFSATVTFDLPPTLGLGMKKLLAGGCFSIGLMLVVIAGAELFTGNSLMVSSVMVGKVTWRQVLAKWALVYGANGIGALILALIFYSSGLWKTGDSLLGVTAVKTACAKVQLDWTEAFVRAVGCNWLVCLAVWMAMASRQIIGKVFAIFFPIMAFVAIGFEHCVANMYFIPVGIFLHNWAGILPGDAQVLTWSSFVFNNLIPVTLGNTLGGVFFVGLGYWGAYLRTGPQTV